MIAVYCLKNEFTTIGMHHFSSKASKQEMPVMLG